MPAADWASRLAHAADETQVIEVCREYLRKKPEALLVLPSEPQTWQLRGPNDVAEHALRLVKAQYGADRATRTLESTAAFFAAASTRISQVLGRPTQHMFGRVRATSDD